MGGWSTTAITTGALWLLSLSASTAVDSRIANCSAAEDQKTFDLMLAAANTSGCAPYSVFSDSDAASLGVTIHWGCGTPSCMPVIEQLIPNLPDCVSTSQLINVKSDYETHLRLCDICTSDDMTAIHTQWVAAGQTVACAPYAPSHDRPFSWPCSAVDCTAQVTKIVVDELPFCNVVSSGNERFNQTNVVLKAVSSCPRVVASTSGNACTKEELLVSGSLWEAAAAVGPCLEYATVASTQVSLKWPCQATNCTKWLTALSERLPSCVAPGSNQLQKDALLANLTKCTDDPTSTGRAAALKLPGPWSNVAYSSVTCTPSEAESVFHQYVAAANRSDCSGPHTSIFTGRVSIETTCNSTCVTNVLRSSVATIPDCFYAKDNRNALQMLHDSLNDCNGHPHWSLSLSVSSSTTPGSDQSGASAVSTGGSVVLVTLVAIASYIHLVIST